jgi:hypothetical protein
MDARTYVGAHAGGFFADLKEEMSLLLKGAEAAAYLWEELASAGPISGAGPRP